MGRATSGHACIIREDGDHQIGKCDKDDSRTVVKYVANLAVSIPYRFASPCPRAETLADQRLRSHAEPKTGQERHEQGGDHDWLAACWEYDHPGNRDNTRNPSKMRIFWNDTGAEILMTWRRTSFSTRNRV